MITMMITETMNIPSQLLRLHYCILVNMWLVDNLSAQSASDNTKHAHYFFSISVAPSKETVFDILRTTDRLTPLICVSETELNGRELLNKYSP